MSQPPHSMNTRSRERQKNTEEDVISPNDSHTVTAFRKNKAKQKQKGFWLDKMPVEIREHIANFVTNGGRMTDDGLNLAHSSELQRSAVLATIPTTQIFFLIWS